MRDAPALRVVLADDHTTVREGLQLLFQLRGRIDVIREVSTGQEAIDAVRLLAPDVLVLDISMPGMNGVEVTQRVCSEHPSTAVVVFTRHAEEVFVQEIFSAGAIGYVLKQSPFDELLAAVQAAAAGRRYLDSRLAGRMMQQVDPRPRLRGESSGATSRETMVLRMAATGQSHKDIAAALKISVKTVEVHKANAMRKLALTDRGDLLRFAVRQGWLYDL